MERPIGEQFYYDGVKLEVVEVELPDCFGCYLRKECIRSEYLNIKSIVGGCSFFNRKDNRNVIFKRLKIKRAIRSTNAEYKRNEKH